MDVSAENFRQGMRRLGGAVNIVTAANGEEWAGLTATAVTSLSAEPPRLLACVNRQGATYDTISKGRKLAVNVLGVQHKALAMRFAGMDNEPESERFDSTIWQSHDGCAPVLKDALVSFICDVDSITDVASHGIIIGNIVDVIVSNSHEIDPLCYVDGDWAKLTRLD